MTLKTDDNLAAITLADAVQAAGDAFRFPGQGWQTFSGFGDFSPIDSPKGNSLRGLCANKTPEGTVYTSQTGKPVFGRIIEKLGELRPVLWFKYEGLQRTT
jgi:hypothetical protein